MTPTNPLLEALAALPRAEMVDIVRRIIDEMQRLEQRMNRYEAQNDALNWITRAQARQVLACGPTKLWELTTRDGLIETTRNGRLVSVASCRAYVNAGRQSAEHFEARLTDALRGKSVSVVD